MLCLKRCSDAVDLGCDSVTIDVFSRDSLSLDSLPSVAAPLLKPDVNASSVGADMPRSSEVLMSSSHLYNDDSATSSALTGGGSMAVPAIILPTTSVNRPARASVPSQQHPKSLDQEFTLLNLDIPNVTVHSVCHFVCIL